MGQLACERLFRSFRCLNKDVGVAVPVVSRIANRWHDAPMLQRTPRTAAKSLRQQRWRERQRRDLRHVGGDVPLDVIETLIDLNWLKPADGDDRRAIHLAMVQALRSIRK